MEKVKSFLKKHKRIIIGAALGAVGGYLYYYFIGCSSGSCAITSKPFNSTLYGAIMGGLLFNLFQKSPVSKTKEDISDDKDGKN